MYPVSGDVAALFEAENRQILRITGNTVKILPTDISVYSGDTLVYQSGDAKRLKLYSGNTEIYDSNGTKTVILYSGDTPIYINDEAGMPIHLEITGSSVMLGSFNIDRFSCIGDKLELGTAIAAELTLKLNNSNGIYDGIVFEGVELFVEVGVADWSQANPTVHWIPCGFFTSDEQPRRLTTISLKALDRMARFDAVQPTLLPWTDGNGTPIEDGNGNIIYFNAELPFPMTIAQTVSRMCTICNVPFTQDISSLSNANVVINSMPVTQQETSYRTILQWCAGAMGCCAFIDWNGELRLQWYTPVGYTSTLSKRFDSDLFENDLTITGVTYTNSQNQTFVAGTDAYAVETTGNLFLDTGTVAKLAAINGAIGGYTYRPFSASVLPAPWLFPMDVITFTDKAGVNHNCAITNVNFGLNGTTELAGKGLTAQLNKYSAVGGLTPAQAQALMVTARQAQEALRNLDNSLTQQEIFDRLTDGGLDQGLALEATMPSLGAAGEKKLYLNLDYARFGKMVADFIQGGTLTLGGLDNADGVLQVLDSSGNVIGTWDNAGITLNKGAIAGPSVTLGGTGNADGVLRVLDSSGNVIGTWDNAGITLNKGAIAGLSVTLGGLGNADGVLRVLDSSGNVIGTFDNSGVDITDGSFTSYSHDRLYRALLDSGRLTFQHYGLHPGSGVMRWNDGIEVQLNDSNADLYAPDADNLNIGGCERVKLYTYSASAQRSEITLDSDVLTLMAMDTMQTVIRLDGSTIELFNYGGGTSAILNSVGFIVTGTKSRLVHTDQYGYRLLYCYETPSPMFGDVGEGVIGGDGLCYVALDAVFAQTIGDGAYQVFLQKYGAGDCWVKERRGGCFIVEGTPGMAFGWEIKAKQRDYEQRRLDRNDEQFSVPAQEYGAEAAQYIEELMNGRVLA